MSDTSLTDFFAAHFTVTVVLSAACVGISLCLIARLWVLQRSHVLAKLLLSVVLLAPIFGWLFFAAFYRAPEASAWTGHAEHGRDAGYAGTGVDHP
jgi:hypothetical protein